MKKVAKITLKNLSFGRQHISMDEFLKNALTWGIPPSGVEILAEIVQRIRHDYPYDTLLNIIPLDDLTVYRMLQSGDTTDVINLQSSDIREMLQAMKPDRFEDIMALCAVYRPGPLADGTADLLVSSKSGKGNVMSLLPPLRPILKESYGIIIYREQITDIAEKLAGFSYLEASQFRNALCGDASDELVKWKERFVTGCKRLRIPESSAQAIFTMMATAAGNAFPKPLAMGYALTAYLCAWLKTYFPDFFKNTTENSKVNIEPKRYSPYLSKSLYIKGLQCHKYLWLHKNKPELKDKISGSQQAAFDSGTDVGILAQRLFPGGAEVPYDGLTPAEQIAQTRQLIEDGVKTIYEATFSFDNIFCKVDILHHSDNGWELHEVKSSTGCKDVYLDDIALQYYAVSGAGLELAYAGLVHIDTTYVRAGEIEVDKLFAMLDLTDVVRGKQSFVKDNVIAQRAMLNEDVPAIDIGPQCSTPYDCQFLGHCWQHVPENSVFEFRGHGKPNVWDLYREGFLSINDVPEGRLGWRQILQQRGLREEFLHVDHNAVRQFLEGLTYPLCFMDFETTFMLPVPKWDGTRPYQQIPFQYSLHVIDKPGAVPRHIEYLADGAGDPRPGFLKALLAAVPPDSCIITWNATFEVQRLRDLASSYPESAGRISGLINDIVDMMVPFRDKSIYHSRFNGSYSIKYVLPGMVADLSYDDLEISNGEMAADGWLRMIMTTAEDERQELRSQLLEYCKLDTLAMVRILEKMWDMVNQEESNAGVSPQCRP